MQVTKEVLLIIYDVQFELFFDLVVAAYHLNVSLLQYFVFGC